MRLVDSDTLVVQLACSWYHALEVSRNATGFYRGTLGRCAGPPGGGAEQ